MNTKNTKHTTDSTSSGPLHRTGSAFHSWFEAQHGQRPTMRGLSDYELEEMVKDGKRAQCVRDSQREYDARLESALYAWTAKDCSEEEIMRRLPNTPTEPRP
jgi:hypothetical protein